MKTETPARLRNGTGEYELASLDRTTHDSLPLKREGAVVLTRAGQKKLKSSSKQWQICAWLERELHRWAHHLVMEKPQKSLLVTLAALLLGAWALIIWVAVIVTGTMLDTLSYIVDLAQLS